MDLNFDTILSFQSEINLIFSLLIVVFGYLAYFKKKRKSFLYITLGFGFFSFSSILGLVGLSQNMFALMILSNFAAFCFILFALFKEYTEK